MQTASLNDWVSSLFKGRSKGRSTTFSKGDNYEMAKIHIGKVLKSSSPESLCQLGEWDSRFYKFLPFNFQKWDNVCFFPNQQNDIPVIICVSWFELFCQVSNMAYGSLLFFFTIVFQWILKHKNCNRSIDVFSVFVCASWEWNSDLWQELLDNMWIFSEQPILWSKHYQKLFFQCLWKLSDSWSKKFRKNQ